ncbi:TlpA family protein disulfide reductase [Belliella sp. R4-6]|uniref:TlpA family protein disulfide reductase n=1 Tax=Belliella alkalica TaxID=1730871 RepID=A0ABS9VAV5_9BACT|nr:TlpA disulfide reductase family protein [Belliella alkalica]MCH7413065.1 TlpA family protein disulfide reductase [Belliella alkalica]
MKNLPRLFIQFFSLSLLLSFQSINGNDNKTFEIISFEEFEGMMNRSSKKIRVYNFWATWCAPCVKEMPYFEKTASEDDELELYFISMDDGRKPERVTSFIDKRNVTHPVYLLNDVDYDKWIDKVNPEWSGAIPATLFIKPNGEKYFHEGEVTEEELKKLISNLK